jgi:hypothetical protein
MRTIEQCAKYMIERWGKKASDDAHWYAVGSSRDSRFYWLQVEAEIKRLEKISKNKANS